MKKQFLPAPLVEKMTTGWPLRKRGQRNKERGTALAIAALGFVTFLLAAGLSIDITHLYLAGTELQNAADAAALAGAAALDSTAAGITKATDNAVTAMNKFEFSKVAVSFSRSDVKFGVNINDLNSTGGMTEAQAKASPTKVRFVKVTVPPKDVGVYFAKLALNADKVSLTRRAVAGQSESGATGDVTPNEICNTYRFTLIEGNSSGDGSLDRLDSTCGSSYLYTPGCAYNVHLTPPCAADLSYYEIVDGDYDQTYTDWDDRVGSRMMTCLWKNKVVPVETHPVANNIKNGLHTMFDTYGGGLNHTKFPPDTNIKQNITFAQYKTAVSGDSNFQAPSSSHPGQPGRRILTLPIIKKSSFVVLDSAGELANMTVHKFGAFFIKKKAVINTSNNTADLQLEYIGDRVSVGAANFNPARALDSTTAKGLAVPVLYK
jgi:Flp pilus assembly protein TadG